MNKKIIAKDCEGKEIKVGMHIEGAMSEAAILGIEGEVEEIKFDERNEPYGKLKGHEGFWHLKQFMIV